MTDKTAKKLAAARKRINFTQKQAAVLCGISLRLWIYYERGEREPHPALLAFYLKSLNATKKTP